MQDDTQHCSLTHFSSLAASCSACPTLCTISSCCTPCLHSPPIHTHTHISPTNTTTNESQVHTHTPLKAPPTITHTHTAFCLILALLSVTHCPFSPPSPSPIYRESPLTSLLNHSPNTHMHTAEHQRESGKQSRGRRGGVQGTHSSACVIQSSPLALQWQPRQCHA